MSKELEKAKPAGMMTKPPVLPEAEFRTGIVPIFENWFANKKLRQMEEATGHMRQIMENAAETARLQTECMVQSVTAPMRIQYEIKTYENGLAFQSLKLEEQRLKNDEQMLKNQSLNYDNMKVKFEYDRMIEDSKNGTD